MSSRVIINAPTAPAVIGTYSQAIRVDRTVYISGQIGLDPSTMTLVDGGFTAEARQALMNLATICEAAGGHLNHIVKLTVYLLSMDEFPQLNALFNEFFHPPFPARAAIAVSGLPKNAVVEMDAIMVIE